MAELFYVVQKQDDARLQETRIVVQLLEGRLTGKQKPEGFFRGQVFLLFHTP